jgi:tetratricopeptide (TPR) repeat protein
LTTFPWVKKGEKSSNYPNRPENEMASSISTQLRPDESILYQASLRPTIVVVCGICLLIAAFFLVMVALNPSSFLQEFFQLNPDKPTGKDDHLFLSVVAIFFIFILYLSVKYLYDYFYSEIAVTNQRIIGNIPTALLPFSLHPVDIPLAELQYVYTTYYGGASCGYVIVVERLGRKTIFRNFADPEELRSQIIRDRVLEKEPPQQVRRRWFIEIFGFILFTVTAIICYGYILPLLESTPKGQAPPPRTAPSAEKYVDQGVKEKAPQIKIKLFTQAIELNPNYAVAYNNRGHTYLTQNDFDQALRDLDQAIVLNPNYSLAYNNRGNVHYQRKEYSQAWQDYDRAVSLQPNFIEAYVNRGNVYFIRKDYDMAIKDFDRVIAIKPDHAYAHFRRGTIYHLKKNYGQALGDYDKAIAIEPNYAAAYYFRAAIYNQQGDIEQAQANYTKAKSLDPKLPVLNIKVR